MTVTEAQFDTKAYGRLLMKAHPVIIKSDAENDRLLTIVESLMVKGDSASRPRKTPSWNCS